MIPTASAAELFRALADPARLAMVRHLAYGPHRVVDLTNHVGLAQSTTSAHLACLRERGLVTSHPVGRSSVYSLSAGPELLEVLAAVEQLLAATGSDGSLRPRLPVPHERGTRAGRRHPAGRSADGR